jgi:hypothetical protein
VPRAGEVRRLVRLRGREHGLAEDGHGGAHGGGGGGCLGC